tara:strand:+ start:251797 stop:252621 length:825 start_codon:yes stop_codon:yes gene_type:complete
MQGPTASAQGLLNQLGKQLGEQIRREIPRVINGRSPSISRPSPNPPTFGGDNNNQQPAAMGAAIPSESGRESTGGPKFNPDDFFGPSPSQPPQTVQPRPSTTQPPRVIYPQPGTTYPGTTYPSQTYPSQTYPSQTYPSSTYPGNTYPSQTYPSQTYESHSVPSYTSNPPRVSSPSVSNREFKIRCPKSLSRSVSYQLSSNGKAYSFTMNPGEMHTIVEARVWRIRYSSGGRDVSYRLRGGSTYEFAIDSNSQLQLFKELETDQEPPVRSSATGR